MDHSQDSLSPVPASEPNSPTRRDFLYVATGAFSAMSLVSAWPLVDQMNPSASVLAEATLEFDMGGVPVGQEVTVKFRGSPVFVRHRTQKEIDQARAVSLSQLRDPESDQDRLIKNTLSNTYEPEWLVVVGVCTHLGCIPTPYQGDYGGWFCPCHGSQYDTSGRIRQGPAPYNLVVPDYEYLSPTKIRLTGIPEAGFHRTSS